MPKRILFIAALSGFFCVAFGAFAAHGLSKILDAQALAWIDTGLKYQMLHTVALIGLAAWRTTQRTENNFSYAAFFWSLGIVLFSGSLYALALGAGKWLVWVTPCGGVAFLIGWVLLAFCALRAK